MVGGKGATAVGKKPVTSRKEAMGDRHIVLAGGADLLARYGRMPSGLEARSDDLRRRLYARRPRRPPSAARSGDREGPGTAAQA
jgi:hypothetical protein